jgi:23S rRNA pseudouridine1911/1915/1917 synthase
MVSTLELEVPPEAAGARLDAWLAGQPRVGSRALAQRLLREGLVQIDGERRPKSHRLDGGERVTLRLGVAGKARGPIAAQPAIVHEDDLLLVVDKPPGVVVHPAAGHRNETLVDYLATRAAGVWTPHVVHRLDRDTSGLMLIAKDDATAERLRGMIRRRRVVREYLTLVKGRPPSRSGVIDAPIGRDPRRRTRMSTRAIHPREARTRFEVERLLEGYTLVRARLETGRTHQIRAHFAAAGIPVCGDPAYGGAGLLGLERQFLHSARLAFDHPADGEPVDISSPLPADLERALSRAESNAGAELA